MDREAIEVRIEIDGKQVSYEPSVPPPPVEHGRAVVSSEAYEGPAVAVPLVALAHGRSGDKGADVNIGIRARHRDFYPVLLRELTADSVGRHLAHLSAEKVTRFELPGIQAVNFLLERGLGEGGTASLRFDPQGKAIAQQLLDMEIELPADLERHPALRSL